MPAAQLNALMSDIRYKNWMGITKIDESRYRINEEVDKMGMWDPVPRSPSSMSEGNSSGREAKSSDAKVARFEELKIANHQSIFNQRERFAEEKFRGRVQGALREAVPILMNIEKAEARYRILVMEDAFKILCRFRVEEIARTRDMRLRDLKLFLDKLNV